MSSLSAGLENRTRIRMGIANAATDKGGDFLARHSAFRPLSRVIRSKKPRSEAGLSRTKCVCALS